MITTTLIPAAGKGTRMLHLTKDKPKPLIEIMERPFLYHLLQNLKEAGLTEFIVITGHQAKKMEEFAQKYKNEFALTLVNQFEAYGAEKYGTATAVECAEKAIGEDQFLCIYGDDLHDPRDIKKFLRDDEYSYMGVIRRPNPERYGVAVTENDFLVKIVEKPQTFISNLTNAGLYKFTPEIFGEVKKLAPSPRGEYELTDAIQALAERRRVKVISIEHYSHEFSRPEDIETIANFLNKKAATN